MPIQAGQMIDYEAIIKPGMRVGLVDADLVDGGTRHPNLVIMKLSGYCKSRKCTVELLESYDHIDDYDAVFVSCVFTFTQRPKGLESRKNVYCGGTGFYADGGQNLPYAIEHHKPDYDVYKPWVEKKIASGRSRSWFADYLDYSVGFTTRGCFRKCSFCVNKKYDHVFRHAPVSEFMDEDRPYIYLWDDNILAFPKWEEVIDELIATGKPFQFRQGLDVRLLTEKKAKKLAEVRYCGDFYFAFDHIEDRKIIERGLRNWRKYTARGTRVYVLCAFDSQDEKDIDNTFKRIQILMHYGCLPYIMRYESYKGSRWQRLYVNIARWCNQPQFFKKKSFREFCETNQQYHRNKNTKCSALQSMEDFESAFPEIAAKYFDLRFEELNVLIRHGRQFFGRPTEEVDREQRLAWDSLRDGMMSKDEILCAYYDKNLDIVWAKEFSGKDYGHDMSVVFETVRTAELDEIYRCLLSSSYQEPISPENILQYSSIDDVIRCAYHLKVLGDEQLLTFEDLGIYLYPDEKKAESAHKKYGENHGKTASLLDLAFVERNANRTGFRSTYFDSLFDALSESDKLSMFARLSLRVPIIRRLLVDSNDHEVSLGDYMTSLAKTTKLRRRPNVTRILDLLKTEASDTDTAIKHALENVRTGL